MMNKNLFFSLLVMLTMTMFSCKTESPSIFASYPQLNALDLAYKENKNVATANELLNELMKVIANNDLSDDTGKQYLEYGLQVSSDQKMSSKQASFLVPLIKENYGESETANRIYDLAGVMLKLKKNTVANTLHKGLEENFSTFPKLDAVKAKFTEKIPSINAYIDTLGAHIFSNPDNTGINRKSSLEYVDACEAYGLVYPKSKSTPEYLFKAAEVAKSLRTFPKSLSLYDWIIDKYPNYDKAATALFLKGFIIENNVGDDNKAREIYNEFLKKYPKDDLADDVQFLIENLGKTDEEILQMIEAKRKDK